MPENNFSNGIRAVTNNGNVISSTPIGSGNLKAIKQGLLQRLATAYKALRGRDLNIRPQDGGEITSWEGSRKAAPSLDRFNREWYEPAERRALIAQIRELLVDHPILMAGLMKFAHGAVSAGMKITVTSAARGPAQAADVQRIIDRLKRSTQLETILPSMAFSLPTYGDCFIQPVISDDGSNEIVSLIEMPAASMERLTNDRDQFISTDRAFIQRDTNTLQIDGQFALGQIIHARHMYTPGHRYGTSQIFTARGTAKDAIDAIRTILQRRMANLPFRWFNLKGFDNNPLPDAQFKDFQRNTSRKIAMELGKTITPFDDLYTNNVEVEVIGGDPEQGNLTDIEMLIDASMSTIGVSRQIIGWGTTVNRDVLDEQRAELYAAQAQFAKTITQQILIPVFEIALKLQDINPDEIQISVEYAQHLTDTQLEKRIENARKDYLSGGLSQRSYVKVLSSYYDINDIDNEVEQIKKEKLEQGQQQIQLQVMAAKALGGLPQPGQGGQPGIGGGISGAPNLSNQVSGDIDIKMPNQKKINEPQVKDPGNSDQPGQEAGANPRVNIPGANFANQGSQGGRPSSGDSTAIGNNNNVSSFPIVSNRASNIRTGKKVVIRGQQEEITE